MFESLLKAGTAAMKYLLFISNFVFVLTGIALVVTGLIIRSSTEHFEPIFKNLSNYSTAPHLLIFIGLLIFFVAFLGCCGALRENHCMVFTFSVLMVAIFIAELVVGITGYVMKADANNILSDALNTTMYKYQTSSEDAALWDKMQGQLDCCGTKNYTDWSKVLNNGTNLPMTCCTSEAGQIGTMFCNTTSADLHKTPCLDVVSEMIVKYANTIGLTGIIIATIQLLGVIFSCMLGRSFRSSYESV